MYPFIRMGKELFTFRNASRLGLFDTHVSSHICWPWDLDFWMELNNGRTLTLYDLGRIPLAHRVGLITTLKDQRWGLTIAGSSVRYRRRVRMFDKIEMRSRCVGFDARFMYLEQSMWKGGECTSHALYRAAVTDAKGIVSTDRILAAMDAAGTEPKVPDWVRAWIDAEAQRPWPPMQDSA